MKRYKSTPNIPSTLDEHGRKYYRNLCNRMIAKDNLNNYTKYQIKTASFIHQYMKKVEMNGCKYTTGEDLELYMKLSKELRAIEKRLFNLSTIKEDLIN